VLLPLLVTFTPQAAADALGGAGVTPSPPNSPLLAPMLKRSTPGPSNTIRNQWQHLQPDPGPTTDASRIAYQRMSHHAGMMAC
jgi:hypothetical protein